MKLLRFVRATYPHPSCYVSGPLPRSASRRGNSTPPTLPSWQVAGHFYTLYRKGGISSIQRSLRTPRPFAVHCPSLLVTALLLISIHTIGPPNRSSSNVHHHRQDPGCGPRHHAGPAHPAVLRCQRRAHSLCCRSNCLTLALEAHTYLGGGGSGS